MKIYLKQSDFDAMTAWARKNLPEEACGLIGGTEEKDAEGNTVRRIRKVIMLTNVDHTSEHFSMDPKEQLAAVQEFRKDHLEVLGNWHSHPSTPSRQSEEDIRLSFNHNYSYLILSLEKKDAPVVHSFHCENRVSTKEELIIEP